jgi:hypothetical protein
LFETLAHALYERCLFEEVSNPLFLLINHCNAMLCDVPASIISSGRSQSRTKFC